METQSYLSHDQKGGILLLLAIPSQTGSTHQDTNLDNEIAYTTSKYWCVIHNFPEETDMQISSQIPNYGDANSCVHWVNPRGTGDAGQGWGTQR